MKRGLLLIAGLLLAGIFAGCSGGDGDAGGGDPKVVEGALKGMDPEAKSKTGGPKEAK